MRKFILLLFLVLLGCGEKNPNRVAYTFVLKVINKSSQRLYVSVLSLKGEEGLGWIDAGEGRDFGVIEVEADESDEDPECTLIAKKEPEATTTYATHVVKLKGLTRYDWTIF
jgi:hypothetical protein